MSDKNETTPKIRDFNQTATKVMSKKTRNTQDLLQNIREDGDIAARYQQAKELLKYSIRSC